MFFQKSAETRYNRKRQRLFNRQISLNRTRQRIKEVVCRQCRPVPFSCLYFSPCAQPPTFSSLIFCVVLILPIEAHVIMELDNVPRNRCQSSKSIRIFTHYEGVKTTTRIVVGVNRGRRCRKQHRVYRAHYLNKIEYT